MPEVTPPPLLVLEHVAQDDHAVGNELLDAVPGDLAVFGGPLRGHDRRHPDFPQRRRDAKQLVADPVAVAKLREDGADRVEDDALGADAADGVLDAGEQGAEVVVADDRDLERSLGRGIDERPVPLLLPAADVPAEAHHVAADVLWLLLEGHEHPRRQSLAHAFGQELAGKDGLAAAGAAGHQRGAALR